MGTVTLRQFVRAVLVEAAVTAAAASSRGLALYVDDSSGHTWDLILYDPGYVVSEIRKIAEHASVDSDYAPEDDVNYAFDESVRGYVRITSPRDPCNGAWEVSYSAADNGVGPLMYDIAMAVAPNHEIMSDRRMVSNSATRVWNHYDTKKSGTAGQVKAHDLDDVSDPKTPSPKDDCMVFDASHERPELNKSYSAESPVDIKQLVSEHEKFLKASWDILGSLHYSRGTIVRKLSSAAENFFDVKYRQS